MKQKRGKGLQCGLQLNKLFVEYIFYLFFGKMFIVV